MIGLFTVDLRGRTLGVNVLRQEITLIGEDGKPLDWKITSDEWDEILIAAKDRGFNYKNWFYACDRAENSKLSVIAADLKIMRDRLETAVAHSLEAYDLIQNGNCNGAIGALVNIGEMLDEVQMLYGAALVLHRAHTSYFTSLQY